MLRVFSHVLTLHSEKLVSALGEYYRLVFTQYAHTMKYTPAEKEAVDAVCEEAGRWMVANILLEGIALANARTHLSPSLRSFDVYGDKLAEQFDSPVLRNKLSTNTTVGDFFAYVCATTPLSALLEGAMKWFVEQFMDEVYNLLGKDSFAIDNYTGIYMTRELLIKQLKQRKIILPFIEPMEWLFVANVDPADRDSLPSIAADMEYAFVVQGEAFIIPETFPTMVLPDETEEIELYVLKPEVIKELKRL
ncbi:hypothetical protein pEaSNUABM11_00236 [Erwinia phage pEa_SNUABM_11]|nr:hypothetical protein pEaSNUABM11_00236 [Erwinia phage pEa_SNUABM_11]